MTPDCDKAVASCQCMLGEGHEEPHRCDCGGQWKYDDAGVVVPVVFPGGFADPLDALFYYSIRPLFP